MAGHSTLHLPNPSCFRLNIEFLFGKKPKTNHRGDLAGWFEWESSCSWLLGLVKAICINWERMRSSAFLPKQASVSVFLRPKVAWGAVGASVPIRVRGKSGMMAPKWLLNRDLCTMHLPLTMCKPCPGSCLQILLRSGQHNGRKGELLDIPKAKINLGGKESPVK